LIRALGGVQLIVGLALLLQPRRVAAAVAGGHRRPVAGWLVRVLGARSVAQGAVLIARPTADLAMAGAAVDATHALSMIPFCGSHARHRRAAFASGATAAALSAAGVVAARHAARETTGDK